MLGYRLKECIAFGDGMNDAEMLSMAGKGALCRMRTSAWKDPHPDLEVIGKTLTMRCRTICVNSISTIKIDDCLFIAQSST